MRTILTAVLLGLGTLGAAIPAEASWHRDAFHRGGISVYVGPSRPAVYVSPTYYPPAVVTTPYVVPTYSSPIYLAPSVGIYGSLPVVPWHNHSYRVHDHHIHYHR